jgi:predicted nucleotidyltransferase
MIKFRKIVHDVEVLIPAVVERLSAFPEVDVLYLYGSRVGGRISPLSDVDLAVLLSKSRNKNELVDLRLTLIGEATAALKTDEIDLQILNDIPMQAQFAILKNKKVLYCRNEFKRVAFEGDVVSRYLDFRPFLEEQYTAMHQRIEDRASSGGLKDMRGVNHAVCEKESGGNSEHKSDSVIGKQLGHAEFL